MKSHFNLKSFLTSSLVFLVLLSMVFSVSAVEINGADFFDYDKYSSYEVQGNLVEVKTVIPDWYYTRLMSNYSTPIREFRGNDISFTVTVDAFDDGYFLLGAPFGQNPTGNDDPDPNGHYMDLYKMPADFVITGGFVMYHDFVSSANWMPNPPSWYVSFVDKEGYYLDMYFLDIAYSYENLENGVFVIKQDFTYDTSKIPIPENARGMYFGFDFNAGIEFEGDYNIHIRYDPFKMTFDIDDAFYNFKKDEIMRENISNIESALDGLPGEIGDEFENVIEQEKEESKQEGNKFVDQVLDKLPDPSQGVLSALGELTSAVGYTGTEAVIPFPAIVVPGIDGLFEDIVIYDGSDFDLGSCVSYIPENILIVIQSLFTIAIVLYCVYELKGIISFIFTLKEKNNG